jgi:nucleoid-associated protein YgaU
MTSDAKIGLLLGLVFIFVIAFVINGLPGLHKNDDGNKLTRNMVGLQSSQQGLGENARKIAMENTAPAMPAGSEQQGQVAVQNPAQPQMNPAQTDPRFQMALPQGSAEPAPTPGTMSVQPAQTQDITSAPAAPAIENPAASPKTSAAKTDTSKSNAKPQTTKSAGPQTYVVQDGDSLSSIAKKVYGEQAGSKLVNVNAIFEANKKTLATPDDLQVGQKLAIPVLASSAPAAPSAFSGQNFAKVESVGQRHSTTAVEKPVVAPKTQAAAPKTDTAKQGKIYVVKEGDSLWRIASDNLGDGNRYKEIVKLNNLASEDDIQTGMQLKLPAK